MFTDMVGYTSLTQGSEKLALELLEEQRSLVRSVISAHEGQEIKTIGDAFLIEFRSALDAVTCAVEIQEAVSRRNLEVAPVKRFQVRIGIHAGDVVRVEGDVYGDTVNIASRIEPLAEPGGIVVSSQIYEDVRNKIGVGFRSLGEHGLRNVAEPILVYRVASGPGQGGPASARSEKRRVAVLPFVNIGADPSDEYLADGLTEELILSLSRLPRLRVVSRTSVMGYKGSKKSASQIGSEIGAGVVLEGSIRRSSGKLRVAVQLVDTASDEYLWSSSYDRDAGDVLLVQQDIAEKTVEALRPQLGGAEPESLRPGRITGNPKAFLLYLQGRYHLTRHSEDEVGRAAELFELATKLDPEFASAFAMCAQCHMFLGFFGFIQPSEAFEKARPLLNRALEIDEGLDLAHMLMGRLLMDRDWDWSGAEAEFKRAVELSPNSAEAHYRYALLLNDMLRNSEALAEVAAAEELDPLSVAVNQIAGSILYFAGRNDEAIERLERAIEMDSRAAFAHNNLGLALCKRGDLEAGLEQIRAAMELDPKNAMFRADLCYAYSMAGRQVEARGVLRLTEEESRSTRVPPMAIAGMHASLGDSDKALQWLERAYEEHSPYFASLKVEKWFDGLRSDERFQGLMRRAGLV